MKPVWWAALAAAVLYGLSKAREGEATLPEGYGDPYHNSSSGFPPPPPVFVDPGIPQYTSPPRFVANPELKKIGEDTEMAVKTGAADALGPQVIAFQRSFNSSVPPRPPRAGAGSVTDAFQISVTGIYDAPTARALGLVLGRPSPPPKPR